MRQCPKCKLEISEQALFCEHCGLRFVWHPDEEGTPSKASGQSPPKGSVLGGLVTFVFSAVILYYLWTNFGYLLNTSSSDGGNAASSQASTHRVKYVADGSSYFNVVSKPTASVHITMLNSSGGLEQRRVDTPYHTEFSTHSGSIVSLSVSNIYEGGDTSAEIYVDGVLLQKARSSGGVASVSGIVR